MATIDSKQIIDEIIQRNGYYEDDPRAYMIVEYRMRMVMLHGV